MGDLTTVDIMERFSSNEQVHRYMIIGRIIHHQIIIISGDDQEIMRLIDTDIRDEWY
jgi:hypothetical protein